MVVAVRGCTWLYVAVRGCANVCVRARVCARGKGSGGATAHLSSLVARMGASDDEDDEEDAPVVRACARGLSGDGPDVGSCKCPLSEEARRAWLHAPACVRIAHAPELSGMGRALGAGPRPWPASVKRRPKQIRLSSEEQEVHR